MNENKKKTPGVEDVFKQIDAGLCLVARVKHENPAKQYFWHSTPHVAKLHLDGGIYQVVITKEDEPDPEGQGHASG